MEVDTSSLGWGFLPNIPSKREYAAEPTDIILSLVGTTSIGFNLFLGGSMAKGKELSASQRGIGFSTIAAFVVSSLILVVGSGNFNNGSTKTFAIADIGLAISGFFGTAGVVVFAVGFIAAALSSMLTVPLGAALAADSVLSRDASETPNNQQSGVDNRNFQMEPGLQMKEGRGEEEEESSVGKEGKEGTPEEKGARPMPRWIYLGIMFVMVLIATVVISANADRTVVILVAQVLNGCLLPFFSICLLLCINDQNFMSSSPQKGWSNVFLFVSVLITLFLASNVLIQKVFGGLIAVYVKFLVAGGLALTVLLSILVFTSLGKDLLRSFRHHCWKHDVEQMQ